MFSCRRRNIGTVNRRGAISVLLVLLLIPLLAFTAYCVDIGWITTTKSELQNAADASAMAGARQLLDDYAAYSLAWHPNRPALIRSASQAATRYGALYAGYNTAGDASSLHMPDEDIQVGFADTAGEFRVTNLRYPNTVRVVARRDPVANNPLPLFFAPVLGVRNSELTAEASATVYTGLISSFDPRGGGEAGGGGGGAWGQDYLSSGSGFDCSLLPVAFDVNSWKRFFITGQSPNGAVYTDAQGAPQIQVYPSPYTAPGNFGMLCIGPWTNSNNQYSNWVLNGPTPDDLQTLIDGGMFPVSEQAPKDWKGSPGLRNALGGDFAAIIGQPRLLPLFRPASLFPYQAASGAGSNASYRIVGFVGVTVTQVTGNGANLSIKVTPCSVVDPTAVFDSGTLYPLGTEPATQLRSFTHTAAKLTH